MAISGGIKVFDRSQCLGQDGAVIAASSGDSSSIRALDRSLVSYWRSVGSIDSITETITITFNASKVINRILLLDHNWKEFTVKYFSGGSYVNFASVLGIDGSIASISETTFAEDSAYYEFAPVATTSIQITVTKTQVVDQEKYINQIIATTELGTLVGYPDVNGLDMTTNAREKKVLSGKIITMKSEKSLKFSLAFKNYPPSLSNDIDLMFSLWESDDTFLIWLCGGRRGSNYFRKQLRGFRLRDVICAQTSAVINPDYSKNVFTLPINFTIKMNEAVD